MSLSFLYQKRRKPEKLRTRKIKVNEMNTAQAMLMDNNLCVLATCSENKPNSSLMQYTCNNDASEMYMLTLKGSSKYRNIVSNPEVSLLVDTRNNANGIRALTIYGKASIIEDASPRQVLITQLVEKNPDLTVFAGNPDVCLISVKIESFLLLDGLVESTYFSL